MSGYQLAAEVAGSIGYFWNVTRSQLYREIRDLAQRGYLTLSESGARDRRLCTITGSGRAAFARWIAREPEQELIRFPLLLKVFFGDAVDRQDLRQSLRVHRERHAQRLARYEQMLPDVKKRAQYPALSLEFGIEYEKAVLRWFDRLELPKKGG
jgi:DNA-binding PadR family transcriptional regulator